MTDQSELIEDVELMASKGGTTTVERRPARAKGRGAKTAKGAAPEAREDLVQRTYDWLRQAILTGQMPPGSDINQVHLSTELGFSRGPLREALRLLEQEGFVTSQYNRRARVAELSLDDLEQVYALRISVESAAARLSVPELTDQDLKDLKVHFAEMSVAVKRRDVASFLGPHRAFHSLILSHAGSRVTTMASQLWEHSERYRHFRLTDNLPSIPASNRLAEHRAILKACQERDGAEAADRLSSHLLHTVLGIIERIDPTHEPVTVRTFVQAPRMHE